MDNLKLIEKINNLIDKSDYKTAYIEIKTDESKYVIEKEKKNQIGFRGKDNEI